MSSVDCFRQFIIDRLTTAAEEIFGVFKQTILKYEDEIDRQRKMLDIAWNPEIKLRSIELPQHVYGEEEEEEEEVPRDQHSLNWENDSSLDAEEPPLIKEEQQELFISEEGEQLVLKQEETDAFMLPPSHEERKRGETGLKGDGQLLLKSNVAVRQNHKHRNSRSTGIAELNPTNGRHDSTALEFRCNDPAGETAFRCGICGKDFKQKYGLRVHTRTHTGEKPYSCKACGKRFGYSSVLKVHMRRHTGEKPYLCNTCGKRLFDQASLRKHVRIHTGEKPYACTVCGRAFCQNVTLTVHMRKVHSLTHVSV